MRCLRPLASFLIALCLLTPVAAQQTRVYRILVSTDDGVRAPGLAALAQALQTIGDVIVVAPSENQSGRSQSLNTLEPIFREDLTLANGLRAVGLTATPATTVQIAIKNIITPRPDLVVVGINNGYNLGLSAYLSGTVGAARQAAMEGVPAIAASIAAGATAGDLVAASEEVLGVARRVKEHGLGPLRFVNVNVPRVPTGGYKGYQIATQAAVRGGIESFAETKHPSGRTLYWSVYKEGATADQGSDVWAVDNGYVAVTPMRAGEFDAAGGTQMREWFR